MRLPLIGLAYVLLFLIGAVAMGPYPVGRAIFGNIALLAPAVAVCGVIASRRRSWHGNHRLFWDVFGVGIGLWVIGHVGWAFEELVLGRAGWLRWHTLFSLCGGIFPLIALLARPHRGVRHDAVLGNALLVASYGLLAVFAYTYFGLVPSLVLPEDEAERTLLLLVQVNRAALVAGFMSAVWVARRTLWRGTYGTLAAGVVAGFFLRLMTSRAILQGSYQSGTLFDLAWIAPFLCYAIAAAGAPRSSEHEDVLPRMPVPAVSAALAAAPVLLIPLIGYGALGVQSLGATGDSFRALLTGLLTVAGLAVLTLRLAVQGMELRRTDARLRLLAAAIERTQDLIVITRVDGTLEHANEAFVRALGHSRDQLARSRFGDLIAPGLVPVGVEIHRAVRTSGVWRGTLVRRRRDGTTFPTSCTVTGLRDGARVTHFVGVEREITEELRLQDQLVKNERLSAIGELVAGVAHEINNPLQTVLGSAELMLEEGPPDTLRKDLEIVRRESARAAQIVRSLLSFVRRGSPDRRPVDLNEVVAAALTLRAFQLQQKSIRLVTRMADGSLPVLASREELQQVILNLLLNAEQAITHHRDTGTITVRTTRGREFYSVQVHDDGPGVDEEVKGRIFEPFFTTKPVGEGTGLGLSISHGIALAHGGALEYVEVAPGATFCLRLPALAGTGKEPVIEGVPASPGARRPPAPSESVVARQTVALVIDDEEDVRRLVGRLLRRHGYDVIEVGSGSEALAAATSHRVALVLCDVRMPGMSGVEFYSRLSSERPMASRRFVFMTGDESLVDPEVTALESVAVLRKPFTVAELGRVVAALAVPSTQ